jgi:hypothetical protein
MIGVYAHILDATRWLYAVIFRVGPFYFDYWSYAHILSGFALICVLRGRSVRHRWLWLLGLLSAYELGELLFAATAINIFLPEILVDKLNDILVGMLAGAAGDVLVDRFPSMVKRRDEGLPVNFWNAAFVSLTIAFFWCGSYGYRYNFEQLNSPVVNWWALLLWTAGLFMTISSHRLLSLSIRSAAARFGLAWSGYLAGLIVFEFVGYRMLGIREVRSSEYAPLMFGLVHGPVQLKLFYVFAGPIGIGTGTLGEWLMSWDSGNRPQRDESVHAKQLEEETRPMNEAV